MRRSLLGLAIFVALATPAAAQLTPEQLQAMVEDRVAVASPMMALLNAPDPMRSLAAVELLLESGEPRLRQMAIDFGLLSASPEVRRAAFIGFLDTRPTLLVELDVSGVSDLGTFEPYFRRATEGATLGTERATYAINVGAFDSENNCYLLTGTTFCAVEVGPTGVALTKFNSSQHRWIVRSFLEFRDPGQLVGTSQVGDVDGGFPTSLSIVD